MSEPLVSVGVPTYNRPSELRRCIEMLIHQSYSNLEILVSDNASPGDEVALVVAEFMRQDPRIRYFRQSENRGAIFNFQFVLEQSIGEYFMWAGDDDYRSPDYVKTLVTLLITQPHASLSFCDFVEVDESGRKVGSFSSHLAQLRPFVSHRRLFRLLRFFFQLESSGKANIVYGLMRRSALVNFDWRELVEKHGEWGSDMLLVFFLLCRGPLALSESLMYRCTVGNVKQYEIKATQSPVLVKLLARMVLLAKQLRYTIQYPLIATGVTRIVLLLFWPLRVLDILIRIYFSKALRNTVVSLLSLWRRT